MSASSAAVGGRFTNSVQFTAKSAYSTIRTGPDSTLRVLTLTAFAYWAAVPAFFPVGSWTF